MKSSSGAPSVESFRHFHGVYTALITPFHADGSLDLESFKKILRDQREAKVAGVIPCGTTGESPTLSVEDKKTLITTALDYLKGSDVQVIAGTGSNCTDETLTLSQWASKQGVAGILVVTPYYNKPSQAAMEVHFTKIADAITCPLIAYNVPGRTGVFMSATLIARLAQHPRITSLKEASANLGFLSDVQFQLRAKGLKMDLLSGDDATYLPFLSLGGHGVISVASNLFPREMVALQLSASSGNWVEARKLHHRFYPLFRDLFVDSNPVPIKYAMSEFGFCKNTLRSPLIPLSEADQDLVDASLSACGLNKSDLKLAAVESPKKSSGKKQ